MNDNSSPSQIQQIAYGIRVEEVGALAMPGHHSDTTREHWSGREEPR